MKNCTPSWSSRPACPKSAKDSGHICCTFATARAERKMLSGVQHQPCRSAPPVTDSGLFLAFLTLGPLASGQMVGQIDSPSGEPSERTPRRRSIKIVRA